MDYTENTKLYEKTEQSLYKRFVKKGEGVMIYDILDAIEGNGRLRSSNGFYCNAIRLAVNVYNRLGFDGDFWYNSELKDKSFRDLVFESFPNSL